MSSTFMSCFKACKRLLKRAKSTKRSSSKISPQKIDGRSVPTPLEAYEYLEERSSHWNEIGRELGLSENLRLNIQDFCKDNDSRLERVLGKWIQTHSSEVSWNHLYCVINRRSLSFADVAKKMRMEINLDREVIAERHLCRPLSFRCLLAFCCQTKILIAILFCLVAINLLLLYFIPNLPPPVPNHENVTKPTQISTNNLSLSVATPVSTLSTENQKCSALNQFIKFANYRAETYGKIKHVDDVGVLPVGMKSGYISLVIVNKNFKFNKDEANQFAEELVLNGPDKLVQEKLDLKDLFKPFPAFNKKIEFVLVSGAPGIGKTTLALQIASNWQTLTDFSLAFLIRLRDEEIQSCNDIEDFYSVLKLPQHIKDCIADTKGKGILWIFDGFDELPLKAQNNRMSSVYHRMIQRKFDDISYSSIIVTSRPVASTKLSQYLEDGTSKHVEIVGFNRTQIEEFTYAWFKNKTNLSSFTDYYTKNPLIESLMYVPLNAVIIAYVFEKKMKDKRPPPHSLTGLYNSLVCLLLERHKLKRDEESPISSPYCQLMTAKDISNSLPSDVKKNFLSLASLAYNGTLSKKYTFSKVEDGLGLMSKVASLYLSQHNPIYSYNFFHTTLQEYLAAIHVAQNSSLIDSIRHHEVVVMFVFGILSRDKSLDMFTTFTLGKVLDEQTCKLRHLYEYPRFKQVQRPGQMFDFDKVMCGLPSDYYIAGHLIANFNVSVRCVSFNDYEDHNTHIIKFISGLNSNRHEGAVSLFEKGAVQVLSVVYNCDWSLYSPVYTNATLLLYDSYRYSKHTLNLFLKTDMLCPLKITSFEETLSFTCGRFKETLNRKQNNWFNSLKIFVDFGRANQGGQSSALKPLKENFHLKGEFDYLHMSTPPMSSFDPLPLTADALLEIFRFGSDRSLKIDTLSLENFDFRNLSPKLHHLIDLNHETVNNQLIIRYGQSDLHIFLKSFMSNNHKLKQLRITPTPIIAGLYKEEMIYDLLQNSTVTHLTMFLSNSSNFINLLTTKKLSSLRIWWSWWSSRYNINVYLNEYKFFQIINSNTFLVNQLDIIIDQPNDITDNDTNALSNFVRNYSGKSDFSLHIIKDSFPISGVISLINATLLNTHCHISISVCFGIYSKLPFHYLKYIQHSDVIHSDSPCELQNTVNDLSSNENPAFYISQMYCNILL